MSAGRTGLFANFRSFVRNNRTFVAVLLVFVIAIPVAYTFRSGQSYLVDARTFGAQVDVEGAGTSWQLYGVTHCRRETDLEALAEAVAAAEAGQADAETRVPVPLCNRMLFTQSQEHRAVAFVVPDGATVALAATPDGGLILSQPAGSDRRPISLGAAGIWNPDDVLILSRDGWRSTGALEFRGNVRIGDEVAQGTQGYLLEGRYEIREKFRRQQLMQALLDLFGSDLSAGQPIPILTGELMRGDQLTFERNGRPGLFGICRRRATETASPGERSASTVPAQGFVVPVLDTDLSGFALRVTSNAAATCVRLSLNSYGAQTRQVAPTWTDRALLDPLLLAVVAIGGFLVAFLALLVEIAEIVRQREASTAPDQKQTGRASEREDDEASAVGEDEPGPEEMSEHDVAPAQSSERLSGTDARTGGPREGDPASD